MDYPCNRCKPRLAYAHFLDMHWLGPEDCPIDCNYAHKAFKDPDGPYWLPVDELYDAFDCSECSAMVKYPYDVCPHCGAKINKVRMFDNTILTTEEFYKFLEEKKNESKKETS